MRKILVFLLSLGVALTFASCREESSNTTNTSIESTNDTIEDQTTNDTIKNETTADTTENETTDNTNKSDDISSDFKAAMDSYEEFMDDYVAFMKKYQNSDGTDLSILSEYSKYLTKYSEITEDFEKWDSENMNTAELAYYLDVQTRVSQKLLEVAE